MEQYTVSIIILTWNQPALTEACLRSIRAHTRGSYEVIVVDNGSDIPVRALMRQEEGMRIVRNEENRGFVHGCNGGAEHATGRFLLFLNNDTEVTEGWLEALVDVMERFPTCGAVGSKLVHMDGTLQEAGSIVWKDGTAQGYGRGDDPARSEYNFLRTVDYCSGACLMVRADLFRELGGFDVLYAPAYYEDSDLCMAIRARGMDVWYQPGSVVLHHEYGSSSPAQAQESMRRNRLLFVRKWEDALRCHYPPSVQYVPAARSPGDQLRVLMIDDEIPQPERGMGFPRAQQLLLSLAAEGYRVTFFPMHRRNAAPAAATQLRRQGIEVITEEERTLGSLLRERRNHYDIVLISRPHNFRQAASVVRSFQPNALLVYDAEAVFSRRDVLKHVLRGDRWRTIGSRLRVRREIAMGNRADAVITVAGQEARLFADARRDDRVSVWGHPMPLRLQETPFHERSGILFVGGGMHPGYPNEDAILFFLQSVWPLLAERLQCSISIVGDVTSEAVLRHANESVRILGQLPDLSRMYASHRVFIAPTRFAAGIPWKVHEAMSYGIPCVVSRLLADQLDAPPDAVLSAERPAEYAEQIVSVYNDAARWESLRRGAARFIEHTCDPAMMQRQICEIIRGMLPDSNR